ncbi:SH2 domain-containing protein 3C isoform X2 [Gadus morhua]|uniref:SH2 domain-containing protein 3C isoform X2 n=1 Tax=Gadus morhua TaxID=8049 RepID=UPI0011B69D21|nr:SH2 domain-containing protein 3C-like isoform X2 [Gadus morhua]
MSFRKRTFKWLGSLTSLSLRWSKDSKAPRQSQQPGNGSATGDEDRDDGRAAGPLSPVSETTMDDMGAMRPRTTSYARSSDNYTHMGTLPRLLSRKKKKKDKGGASSSTKEKNSPPRAQNATVPLTCDPNVPPPADKPAISKETEKSEKEAKDTTHDEPSAPEAPTVNAVTPSEVTEGIDGVVSHPNPPTTQGTFKEPIRDEEEGEKTEKGSEAGKISDNVSSHTDSSDPQGEYVQFSKEKYLLESPPEKLGKELEEELRLSPSDIRSHGWYHGHIPREVAETVVQRNGDFLVRDSLTSVGDYVLTCRWDNEVLHLKISKVLVKASETKVQYMLEAGDGFDSVQELVRFYVGQRRAVVQPGGAHIYCPVSRTLPLRYLEATFALAHGKHAHSPASQRGGGGGAHIKRRSVTMTDGLTTERMISHSPSTIHHHKDAMRNCAMSMDQIQEYHCPLSPVGETPLSPAYSAITRHRAHSSGRVLAVIPPSPVLRRSSDPQLSPSADGSPPPELPPHHTSHSAHSSPAHRAAYPPHPTQETGGSYCDLRPCPAGGGGGAGGAPPKPPAKGYVERLKLEEGGAGEAGRQGGGGFSAPHMETASSFRPSRYESSLMPTENKPLEMSVLKRVKELLAEVDARTAARHITLLDCKVARILGVSGDMQKMMGVASGLELLTLPHGHQLRLDLLERFYTMSIMVAVDLLGCTGSTEERAALLHKTIQLAAELKSNLGNMFGFAAVMRALEMPQISRLEQTWVTLRQRHTEGAILYEKKLKPFMKNMNDCQENSALSNTAFPHVVPVLSLLERSVPAGDGPEPWESVEAGVDVVMCHLEAARAIAHHGALYRTNAEARLQGFQERPDVLEIFQTEFQMRLLWGSRGSEGSQSERYEKFDKVLTALSHKLEPPVRQSEL